MHCQQNTFVCKILFVSRERGALALEEKLVITTSEAGPEDASPKISIGNFELVASEELLV